MLITIGNLVKSGLNVRHAYWKKINTILLKRRAPLNLLSLSFPKPLNGFGSYMIWWLILVKTFSQYYNHPVTCKYVRCPWGDHVGWSRRRVYGMRSCERDCHMWKRYCVNGVVNIWTRVLLWELIGHVWMGCGHVWTGCGRVNETVMREGGHVWTRWITCRPGYGFVNWLVMSEWGVWSCVNGVWSCERGGHVWTGEK